MIKILNLIRKQTKKNQKTSENDLKDNPNIAQDILR